MKFQRANSASRFGLAAVFRGREASALFAGRCQVLHCNGVLQLQDLTPLQCKTPRCSALPLGFADAKPPRCWPVAVAFAACGRRRGCLGPRWAETAFLPTANAPTGRVGRGLDRRRDRRDAGGRFRSASHVAERGPTASARSKSKLRSPRNPRRSGRIQAHVSGEPSPGPACRSRHRPPGTPAAQRLATSAAGNQRRRQPAPQAKRNARATTSPSSAAETSQQTPPAARARSPTTQPRLPW
jgi:hypothetical protein